MQFDWQAGALADGLRLYRGQQFFAAHESWEGLWLQAKAQDKLFLQGLIQVTAAFHHWQRDNALGAERLLRSALRKLERCPADFGSLSLDLVCNDIRVWLQALQEHEEAPEFGFVRIR